MLFRSSLLATLYRLDAHTWRVPLQRRKYELLEGRTLEDRRDAAGLMLHAGLYDEAVSLYTSGGMLLLSRSPAFDHYNLACAYASWSLEPGDEDPQVLRDQALLHLTECVKQQWTDIAWMELDRDLDPIRDTPTYRALLDTIRRFVANDHAIPAVRPGR